MRIIAIMIFISAILNFTAAGKQKNYPLTNDQKLFGGFIDGSRLITAKFTQPLIKMPEISEIQIKDNKENISLIKKIEKGKLHDEVKIILKSDINIKREYFISHNGITKRLIMNKIYSEKKYFDLNCELGAISSKKETTFRLYAPRAEKVKINIYDNPVGQDGEISRLYDLKQMSGGVWELKLKTDLHGKYYTYQIVSVGDDCHPDLEVIDPYAKLVTRGDGINVLRKNDKQKFDQTLGRAMIIDFSRTNRVASLASKDKSIGSSIIWEAHVRDISRGKNSGVPDEIKGTYLGAAKTDSKYKNYSTGIDHLVELGVNTIHLLPVNEYVTGNETDFKHKFIGYKDQGDWPNKRYYDWGYGPIYYFSPEGYYSTNPDNLSRINEMKDMISEFHKKGIKVVFDVVFNHTFEGSRTSPNIYSFRGIDTDHYYRSMADGTFYDGIFCQNEVNTENPMTAKLLLDCLSYWVNEFKVDGFRFDWMSAYDPDNMAKMVKTLRKINPDLLIYGELWTLRGLSYKGKNSGTYLDRQHIGLFEKDYNLPAGSLAGFNDYFRDAVKGSGFMREHAGGYIQNTINEKYYPATENGHKPYELVKKVITGMIDYKSLDTDPYEWYGIRSPLNSINYIDCHDGYTLFDKLIISNYCNFAHPCALPKSSQNPGVVDLNDKNIFKDPDIENSLIKMNNLGAAILLTSQGIPFIHAGQELLRQKINYIKDETGSNGYYIFDDNSNTSSDETNAIRWEDKEKYHKVFEYYTGLIKLRNEHPTFRRTTAESVRDGLKFHNEWLPVDAERCIAYSLTDKNNKLKSEKWKEVIVLMNPYPDKKTFTLPEGNWNVVVNGTGAGTEVLYKIKGGKSDVEGISIMVMYR